MSRKKYYSPTDGKTYGVLISYEQQREGLKSDKWYIRIMDNLCRNIHESKHIDNDDAPTLYHYIMMWGFAIGLSLFAFSIVFNLLFFLRFSYIDCSWCWIFLGLSYLPIDHLYQYQRCKYLKKHDLPGPYGWGTLDKEPIWSYVVVLKYHNIPTFFIDED